jgi:hypothetical protein
MQGKQESRAGSEKGRSGAECGGESGGSGGGSKQICFIGGKCSESSPGGTSRGT